MVRIECRTNQDDFGGAEWPTHTYYPPKIGERVRAKDGRMLAVVSIAHGMTRADRYSDTPPEPVLLVELNRWSP
tara:strand:- start:4988 stop:5209 length:222 start_codon:yes stop_codon:yes gene_type:complete